MRIGYDAKRLFNNFTGLGNYSRTLLANLLQHSTTAEQLVLYTPKVKKTPETAPFLEDDRLEKQVHTGRGGSYWRTFGLIKHLVKDKIDVYHGLSHELPVGIGKSTVASVVTIHDLIFKPYPGTYSLPDRLLYDWKFRYSCRYADRVIAISESTKADICHYYGTAPEKVQVIYQSCHPTYYLLRPDVEVLYVGSLIERKNLHNLLKAYEMLPTADQVPLVVVGKGESYKKQLLEQVPRHIQKLIYWRENIRSPRHLQCLYQGATALVYPSYYEGFGLPVAEALLSGTPAITSNVSSMPEAAGPGALLVEPHQPASIAEALQKLLADSQLQQQLAQQGQQYARDTFSPERVTKQLLELYGGLM